jgi:alpha-glucuronidase
MRSGRTLRDEIVETYKRGALEAKALERRWIALRGRVDDDRFTAVLTKLHSQAEDAGVWSAKCVAFFEKARAGTGR